MENREDLKSILPFLSLALQSSSLCWPSQTLQTLTSLSKGPLHSNVNSGETFFLTISDLRQSLSFSYEESLAFFTSEGYTLFFDKLMSSVDSKKWFEEIVPSLASLLLRIPALLEAHYENADKIGGVKTGLRVLESQEAGIVFLSQELIAALLACSLFCVFPSAERGTKSLPMPINFDDLFAGLCPKSNQKQESKILCLVHYFKRICASMPKGFVSFQRKVLPKEENHHCVSYPKSFFWSESTVSLSSFEVSHAGLIEDQLKEALEVDFANKFIGGGALKKGCVQEEIRFMINPELIIGRLFLPRMADNEAIEIVGPERFSKFTGYASTFCFTGDYLDKKPIDCMGRRKTRIIAMDALCRPEMRQYKVECLLREINKAFCGFVDQSEQYQKYFQVNALGRGHLSCVPRVDYHAEFSEQDSPEQFQEPSSTVTERTEEASRAGSTGYFEDEYQKNFDMKDNVGIVTGNWGCGAFGGDIELKVVVQWLAASQALRPFILYCTFQEKALQNLEQVTRWILSQGWTVGDLWKILGEYSSQRFKGETRVGFFSWLIPPSTSQCESTPCAI